MLYDFDLHTLTNSDASLLAFVTIMDKKNMPNTSARSFRPRVCPFVKRQPPSEVNNCSGAAACEVD